MKVRLNHVSGLTVCHPRLRTETTSLVSAEEKLFSYFRTQHDGFATVTVKESLRTWNKAVNTAVIGGLL